MAIESAHRYKIFVAGNHDVLLDEDFLLKHPERRYCQDTAKDDLDWGSVIYLQDSLTTLDFPVQTSDQDVRNNLQHHSRKLTIYGSPWTPRYGMSAFQFKPDSEDHWASRYASVKAAHKPDIIATHGPPKHHLDARDFHRAGCPSLSTDLISPLRPRLVVFGHIHASYGREDVILDGVQRAYEDVMTGWGGWATVGWMAILVLWGKLPNGLIKALGVKDNSITTFVNASMLGGPANQLMNEPIVVQLCWWTSQSEGFV